MPTNCKKSSKSILKFETFKITNIEQTNHKSKKKLVRKKTLNLNKKLNTISKNIKNMSNSINNPNEFYMNFFNNILQKENKSVYEEEREPKSKRNDTPIKDNMPFLSERESQKILDIFDDQKSKNN